MSALAVISNDQEAPAVDARALHAALGCQTPFSDWFRRRVESYGFAEGKDFYATLRESSGGRPGTDYSVSISMAKELAMVENNDHGRAVRHYLISMEEEWNRPESVMARALLFADVRMKALTAKVAEDAPKVEFYDRFSEAGGGEGLQHAARVLGLHPNKWIKRLQHEGYLFKRSNAQALVPYERHLESGLFEVRVWVVNGTERRQTYVTPKGLQFFAKKHAPATDRGARPAAGILTEH